MENKIKIKRSKLEKKYPFISLILKYYLIKAFLQTYISIFIIYLYFRFFTLQNTALLQLFK